jgi:hypothetical protein
MKCRHSTWPFRCTASTPPATSTAGASQSLLSIKYHKEPLVLWDDMHAMTLVMLLVQKAGLSRRAVCKDVGGLQPLRPSGVHVYTPGFCIRCADDGIAASEQSETAQRSDNDQLLTIVVHMFRSCATTSRATRRPAAPTQSMVMRCQCHTLAWRCPCLRCARSYN